MKTLRETKATKEARMADDLTYYGRAAGILTAEQTAHIGAPYASNVWRIYVTDATGAHVTVGAFSRAFTTRAACMTAAQSAVDVLSSL